MKFLQAEIAYVRYHLAEIRDAHLRDDWNDPRAHLREAHKGLDAIEVGLQRLPREFYERVLDIWEERTGVNGKPRVVTPADWKWSLEQALAELEGEGLKA